MDPDWVDVFPIKTWWYSSYRYVIVYQRVQEIVWALTLYLSQYVNYYCWWLKSCTTWDIWNPTNNEINYQPQLVSRISGTHQQYVYSDYPLKRILTKFCYIRLTGDHSKLPDFGTGILRDDVGSVDVGEFLEKRDESIVFLCGCFQK